MDILPTVWSSMIPHLLLFVNYDSKKILINCPELGNREKKLVDKFQNQLYNIQAFARVLEW